MWFRSIGALALLLVAGTSAFSAAITVGSHDLLPNAPGQVVQLYVASDTSEAVTGFNLRAQIGDGEGGMAEPVFEGISFSGGMWDVYSHKDHVEAWLGPLAQGHVFGYDIYVAASGLVVTLTIDTTGFTSGSYPLLLKDNQVGTSDFVVNNGSLVLDITNGTINIVPEPGVLWLLPGTILLARRRR